MTAQIVTVNRAAGETMHAAGASAATDVTGFGLLGHALNVARASKKTLRIWSGAVPLLPRVLDFAREGVAPAGLRSNLAYASPFVRFDESVPEPLRMALADPQTSGGLLIAIAPKKAAGLMKALQRAKVEAAVVGETLAMGKTPIEVGG
jgi:selenide,water dikinase